MVIVLHTVGLLDIDCASFKPWVCAVLGSSLLLLPLVVGSLPTESKRTHEKLRTVDLNFFSSMGLGSKPKTAKIHSLMYH